MTAPLDRLRGPVVAVSVVVALLLGACSGDEGGAGQPDPGGAASGPADGPSTFAEVRPDTSPQGQAALGCSIHASLATVDPAKLINRRDPRQAASVASSALLVAAGVADDAAYGALVEPASALQFAWPQGDWERVATLRNEITRKCGDIASTATNAHVHAAYSCAILARLARTAPSKSGLVPGRLTPAADQLTALLALARAAGAADDDYTQLARRAARVEQTVATDAGTEEQARARARTAAACRALGAG